MNFNVCSKWTGIQKCSPVWNSPQLGNYQHVYQQEHKEVLEAKGVNCRKKYLRQNYGTHDISMAMC